MAAESKLQGKIIAFLEARGFVVIKIIVANKAGHADIISCAPNGRFFAIEVKDNDTPRALQEYQLSRYNKNNGIGIWCDSLNMFTAMYNSVEHLLLDASGWQKSIPSLSP